MSSRSSKRESVAARGSPMALGGLLLQGLGGGGLRVRGAAALTGAPLFPAAAGLELRPGGAVIRLMGRCGRAPRQFPADLAGERNTGASPLLEHCAARGSRHGSRRH